MDDLARGAFLSEVEAQAIYALNALTQFRATLPLYRQVEVEASQRRFELACEAFRAIHSVLTHAGCLSRLLWPAARNARAARAQARGELIRSLLDLPDADASVLSQRDLRNHLEHYDERLDEWAAKSPSRQYVHDVIMPFRRLWGAEDRDIMRWYDPSTDTYRFQGEVFHLGALEAALKTALVRAQDALQAHDPSRALYGPRAAS
jgi:hypothetical protein